MFHIFWKNRFMGIKTSFLHKRHIKTEFCIANKYLFMPLFTILRAASLFNGAIYIGNNNLKYLCSNIKKTFLNIMVCTIRNYRKILLRFTFNWISCCDASYSCNIAATKTFIAENLHISWGKNVMHWYTKPTILLYILTKKYMYVPILLL